MDYAIVMWEGSLIYPSSDTKLNEMFRASLSEPTGRSVVDSSRKYDGVGFSAFCVRLQNWRFQLKANRACFLLHLAHVCHVSKPLVQNFLHSLGSNTKNIEGWGGSPQREIEQKIGPKIGNPQNGRILICLVFFYVLVSESG